MVSRGSKDKSGPLAALPLPQLKDTQDLYKITCK